MALNIKDAEVDALAAELAARLHTNKPLAATREILAGLVDSVAGGGRIGGLGDFAGDE